MLEGVFLTLFGAAWTSTIVLFLAVPAIERGARFFAFVHFMLWIAVAYGAQGVEVVNTSSGGVAHTSTETTMTVLGVAMVAFGAVALILALFGVEPFDFEDEGETFADERALQETKRQING